MKRCKNKYPVHLQPKTWYGLDPKFFQPYRKYVNREKPGICGTYVSAALLHSVIRLDRDYELDMDKLIQALRPLVDGRHFYPGTYYWDLVGGLNELLEADGHYRARWHWVSDPIVLKMLNDERPLPVIVGGLKPLGNHYGNHWLLAYRYGYNAEGKLFYRCYDNHGRIHAVVAASQTLPAVWLERI